MCLRNIYYPLVIKSDGKRKVLFNYGIKVNSREALDDLVLLNYECKKAKHGFSNYLSLNTVFKKEDVVDIEKMVQVPCGCCRECLDSISREWAFRILKEASQYDNNYFITFTFNDDFLPSNGMLNKLFFQEFNKNLKNKLRSKGLKSDFRFYGVGEYGSKNGRPHYHCIYFNLDLPDLKFEYMDKKKGFLHFSSKIIEEVFSTKLEIQDASGKVKKENFSNGFVDIGSVDIGSACYVARYCEKKRRLNKTEKEELIKKGVVPEFSAMSRRPGIGSAAYNDILEDFKNGISKHFVKGQLFSLPIYYSKKIKESLKDTQILEDYENNCREAMAAKLSSLMIIADFDSLDYHLQDMDKKNKRGL